MATLLSLPLELRSQIYLDTLSRHLDQPPAGRQIPNDDSIPSFWELSFPPALLFANKQIHAEVKHVFYGKNTWVMATSMEKTSHALPPTAAIPYVRTALLKIHLDALHSFRQSWNRYNIDENCRMLCRIPTLQTLRIECAENTLLSVYPIECAPYYPLHSHSAISSYLKRSPEMREHMNECLWDFLETDQEVVSMLLQPLLALPSTCSLRKGDICVEKRDMIRARILERAFSNCLDAVIALRLTMKSQRSPPSRLPR